MKIKPRDIERFFDGFVTVENFTANGTLNSITTAVRSALNDIADDDPEDLPLTESSGEAGTVSSQLVNIRGYEDVYGRLSYSGQDLILSYYHLVGATETPYSFDNTVIAFDFVYSFDIANLPKNYIVSVFNSLKARIIEKETIDPAILRVEDIGQSIQPFNSSTATVNDAIAMSLIFG